MAHIDFKAFIQRFKAFTAPEGKYTGWGLKAIQDGKNKLKTAYGGQTICQPIKKEQ